MGYWGTHSRGDTGVSEKCRVVGNRTTRLRTIAIDDYPSVKLSTALRVTGYQAGKDTFPFAKIDDQMGRAHRFTLFRQAPVKRWTAGAATRRQEVMKC
jgi:hypothetical protein